MKTRKHKSGQSLSYFLWQLVFIIIGVLVLDHFGMLVKSSQNSSGVQVEKPEQIAVAPTAPTNAPTFEYAIVGTVAVTNNTYGWFIMHKIRAPAPFSTYREYLVAIPIRPR